MTISAAMRMERRAQGWRGLLRAWRDRFERFLAARAES